MAWRQYTGVFKEVKSVDTVVALCYNKGDYSMRLSHSRILSLASAVANRLINASFIRYSGATETLTAEMSKILEDEFAVEGRLDEEVEKLIQSYGREIERGQIDSHQMFTMIKKKLAKERGIIL